MVGCLAHPISEIAAHGHTRGDKPKWRILADLARELDRRVAHLMLRHQHIRKAHRVGFLAGHTAAGIEHQRGFGLANHSRQRDSKAEAGVKAQSCEIGAEARLRTGHAEVSHHRKAQATTDSCSMYRCDNWFFGTKEPVALDIKWRDTWTWLIRTAALRVKR